MAVMVVQVVLAVQQKVVTAVLAALEAMEVLLVTAEVAARPAAGLVALTVKDLSLE
jgi:hypothetical protein